VHSAHVSELEIPVTIQASKLVEGTDRRELFTEATKTTIVYENGAVLCLKSSVLPGQCVSLRNQHSGKEILCKVLESRQGGLAHYTNLEFVDRDPKFWDVPAEQPVAARQTPEIQKIESDGSSPVTTPRVEPSSRAGGDIPLTVLETNTMAPVCPESRSRRMPAIPTAIGFLYAVNLRARQIRDAGVENTSASFAGSEIVSLCFALERRLSLELGGLEHRVAH
jgi:hypothetical protein